MNKTLAALHPMRILGVFAHPDDESFCAGGTLARYVASGAEVMVVSATRGEAGKSAVQGLPLVAPLARYGNRNSISPASDLVSSTLCAWTMVTGCSRRLTRTY